MENENQISSFDFLKKDYVSKYFADTNLLLLNGKHIMSDDLYCFQLLDEYFDEMKYFYEYLYQLNLQREIKDGHKFYYLDFQENSKGKLADDTLHRAMTEKEVIFGIIFSNLYFEKIFEAQKKFTWDDISEKIFESEFKGDFQQLFFGGRKDNPSENDLDKVRKNFKITINEFEKLGWTKWLERDNFEFEVRASIHRFISLYQSEIENIKQTLEKYEER